MIKFSYFLILSVLSKFLTASNFRNEDSDDERRLNKNKRCRLEIFYFPEFDRNDFGINTMTSMLNTTGLVQEEANPSMKEFYNRIIGMTDRQISNVVDEFFYSLKFDEIKYLDKRGLLNENVDEDHLIWLCNSENPISFDILRYLIDKQLAVDIFKKKLVVYLLNCSSTIFDKFELLWNKFEGHLLPAISLGIIVSLAVNNLRTDVYDLVMGSVTDPESINVILNACFSFNVINSSSQEVLNILMTKSVPFKNFLSIISRIKILNLAAKCNNWRLTKYILQEDEDIKAPLMESKIVPWVVAIQNDFPHVLEVYIDNMPLVNMEELVKNAMISNNQGVIYYLKSLGFFNQWTLIMIAKNAIDFNEIDIARHCINHGLDFNLNIFANTSIFNYAVIRNSVDIVELCLKEGKVDINEEYQSIDQIFTSLYHVKSKEMVQLFYNYGANLNYIHKTFDSDGNIVKSETKMHMAAATNQVNVYQALRSLGADPKIPNEMGTAAEEIFDGLDDLYN